jgi:hypothetical protein
MHVPVTARLSKLFYERLGEQATNELVDWFNAVDATYRAELRDMNELNFARFDAKVGQRFAEFDTRFARFDARFAEFEARTGRRFADFEVKFDHRLVDLETKVDRRIADIETKFERRFGEVRADMADLKADLIKWMFVFWAGTALAGLLLR